MPASGPTRGRSAWPGRSYPVSYTHLVAQVEAYRAALWDPVAHLYAHIWDDGQRQWVDPGFWGVGNGWAAAGLARLVKALPETIAARLRLAGYAREVIDGCLACLLYTSRHAH